MLINSSNYQQQYSMQTSLISSFTGVPAPSLESIFPKNMGSVSNMNEASLLFNKQAFDNVKNLITSAHDLWSEAIKLTDYGKNNALDSKVVTSTTSAIEIKSVRNQADLNDYKIEVNQLAKNQENDSEFISKSDVFDNTLTQATDYKFNLEADGKTYNFNVSIDSNETNNSVMQKISKSINDANIGFNTEILTNDVDGTNALKITNEKTGLDNSFTLTDVQGDIVSKLQLNTVSENAQNAIYKVDNNTLISSTNTVGISETNVLLEFKDVTTQEETISVKPDVDNMKNVIRDFTATVNTFMSNYQMSLGFMNSQNDIDVNHLFKNISDNLSSMGISKKNGEFVIDSEKFDKYFQDTLNSDTKMSELIQNFNGINGISINAQQIAERFTTSPIQNIISQKGYNNTNSQLSSSVGNLFNTIM